MSDVYADNLQRDASESQRLEEQFDLLTENIGYLIHPLILARLPPLSPPLQIADLATGTACFLKRVAQSEEPRLQGAILHGSDLSTALFPPSDSLPSSIRLSLLDVRAPVPTALHGMYDFVHVRQIAAGLTPADWVPVITNVAKLLKPGGAMQWEECDFSNVVHLRGGEGGATSVDAARTLGRMFRTGLIDYFKHGWDLLEEAMKGAGLVQVGSEMVSSDRVPGTRKALTRNGMQVILDWARVRAGLGQLRAEDDGRLLTVDEVERLGKQAYKDIESGCYVRFDIHVAWGFRPDGAETLRA
ncbi:hypothetical protein P170DRAFT_463942 [Aspergillus steynii IBT 23096]|uniref:Methyltransferase domain-containing protein n=1 Tax=Aspergillus steynii IBT 23096 TaxID=1392250 RepID=A0A2I2GDC2_9EURO|nr:uncharacterized protein P170DRAFT_463942 [Aspergillus steynii IBT 23096]PLB50873.1 hypothetical protein P170DRAFT_463942 [Aspergillus steynii IBT 23096]